VGTAACCLTESFSLLCDAISEFWETKAPPPAFDSVGWVQEKLHVFSSAHTLEMDPSHLMAGSSPGAGNRCPSCRRWPTSTGDEDPLFSVSPSSTMVECWVHVPIGSSMSARLFRNVIALRRRPFEFEMVGDRGRNGEKIITSNIQAPRSFLELKRAAAHPDDVRTERRRGAESAPAAS
jgi:hypothetical protein